MLRFVNASGTVAVISWRNAGTLVEYHRLAADSFVDQETYDTHEWFALDEAGNPLLDYTASAAETQCIQIE